jgi:nucleotide-binding universal stress UspA family protein
MAAAVVEARRRHAQLEILHIVDQGVPLASVSASEGVTPLVLCPELLFDLRESARAKIEAALAKLGARAEVAILEGHAVKTILERVRERRPELLVVGTRGRTGLARILLGSIAEKLVRDADVSMLVARLAP